MPKMIDVKELILNNKMLTAINENWRSYHQEVADFCLPNKAWQNSPRITGDRMKFNFLYDTVAMRALDTYVAGFHSNLTNPTSQWHALEPEDRDLLKDKEAMLWFEKVAQIQRDSLNRSNFNPVQKEFYQNYGAFGVGVTMQLKDFKTRVRFTPVPTEQVNLVDDAYGRVCEVYRTFKFKTLQAWRLWGAAAGKNVADAMAGEKYFEEFEFLHYCGPRDYYDQTKEDALNMPFQSVWINVKEAHLIKESGFRTFPYHCARANKPFNDTFGYSQAMKALASIKLINAQKRTTLRGAMKATDPPVQVPTRGYILPLNFNPSAINYRNEGTNHDAIQPMPVGNGNFQIAIEMMNMERADIEEFFFVPLFKALSQITKQMTVPEVQQRIKENMILLGPAVGDITEEYLDSLIIHNFNIHMEEGWLPEAPASLQGKSFKTIYLSPLAMAQREIEVDRIDRFLARIGQVAQIKPGVLDKIDEDKTVDVIAQASGVTKEIMRDPREVEQIRAERAKAQQAAMQMQAAGGAAQIAKTGAEAAHKSAQAEAAGIAA